MLYKKASHSCRITCKCNESAQEQRIVLYKSNQQQQLLKIITWRRNWLIRILPPARDVSGDVLAGTKIQSCGREGDYTCTTLSPPEWFCIEHIHTRAKHVHTRAKTKCTPVFSAAAVWLWAISCTNYVSICGAKSYVSLHKSQLLTRNISQSWISPGSICLLFFVLLLPLFFLAGYLDCLTQVRRHST